MSAFESSPALFTFASFVVIATYHVRRQAIGAGHGWDLVRFARKLS